jgi:phosphate transport system substrate-binding protein
MARGSRARRGVFLACGLIVAGLVSSVLCLAGAPALAQQETDSITAIPHGAGESAVAPTVAVTQRKELLIVGSSTVEPYARAAVEALQRDYVMPPPTFSLNGTTDGIKRYCAGVGAKYPDIVVAARVMEKGEFDTCMENGVLDTIEVKIGQTAFIVVAKKGDPVFNITPRMMYFALAKEIPEDGEFERNPFTTWRQIDKAAPDMPINVIIPTSESGLRSRFDDNFLQGGCRHLKLIDAIFSAAERVPRCITLRTDGHITQLDESKVNDTYGELLIAAMAKAPAGTLGLAAYPTYLRNKDKFDVLPVDGVLPDHDSISDYSYEMTSDLRFYFKRAHMRNNEGQGVVRGIRELMTEITKETAMGEGGYFESLGLISFPDDTRDEMRRNVARLVRFKR